MAKFIIGGVALAATGYGLKRYIDSNDLFSLCKYSSNDSSSSNKKASQIIVLAELKEAIQMLEVMKEKLSQTTLMELDKALSEIKNLKREPLVLSCKKHKYKFTVANENSVEEIQCFNMLLIQAEIYINENFHFLDHLITSSSDLNSEDKPLVENIVNLSIVIDKILQAPLTYDGQSISREYKRAFQKLKTFLEQN